MAMDKKPGLGNLDAGDASQLSAGHTGAIRHFWISSVMTGA